VCVCAQLPTILDWSKWATFIEISAASSQNLRRVALHKATLQLAWQHLWRLRFRFPVACCVASVVGAAAHGQALIGVAEKLVLLHACTATLGGTCMLGTGVASIQGLIDALLIALFHWPPVSVS
jgi:hypothetical protein